MRNKIVKIVKVIVGIAIIVAVSGFVGFKIGQENIKSQQYQVAVEYHYQTKNIDRLTGGKLIPVKDLDRDDLINCYGKTAINFADEWSARLFLDEIDAAFSGNSYLTIEGYTIGNTRTIK